MRLEFNFAVRHTSGHTEPLRESMTSQWYNLSTLSSLTLLSTIFFSKRDVTMASGSQSTVRTRKGYSGSNVRSYCSRCRRHDTLLLLAVITKVPVECIIELSLSHVRARIWCSNQKKMQKLAELFCRTSNIYSQLQTLWSSQTKKNNKISNFKIIFNIFEFISTYFHFHFSMGS